MTKYEYWTINDILDNLATLEAERCKAYCKNNPTDIASRKAIESAYNSCIIEIRQSIKNVFGQHLRDD